MSVRDCLDSATGYAHAKYAASLSEFGSPRLLPLSQGWILERTIPETDASDAMGCYPLFVCRDWSRLGADLDELQGKIVSLVVVPDPFGAATPEQLQGFFPDLARPYAEHRVVDLRRLGEISRHHRKCARQAMRRVDVDVWFDGVPPEFAGEWHILHRHLVRRHDIVGIRALSPSTFERQLEVPGLVALRATLRGVPVAAQLWFVHGDVAYGHVLAISPDGYRCGAAYALYFRALEDLAKRVAWCDLGAVPNIEPERTRGLDWFKRGWSNASRWTWLCGRIFDRQRYELIAARNTSPTDFFPSYRASL